MTGHDFKIKLRFQHMKQKDFAKLCGVTTVQVSKWVNDHAKVPKYAETILTLLPKKETKNKMKIIIISGAPRTGKDTFIELLSEMSEEYVITYSSIDWVKEQAYGLGWDGIKDTAGRNFLSEIKDACTKYNDAPFREIEKRIKKIVRQRGSSVPFYFCTNIREPAEIQKLENWASGHSIPCYSVWIRRGEAEEAAKDINNTGDTQYRDHAYDFIIRNDTDIAAFEKKIGALVQIIEERENPVPEEI